MLHLGNQGKGSQIPRAPRNNCEQRVTVQDGMSRHFGLLINVSGSGGLLQTDCTRKIGDRVLILLRIRNIDHKICHVVINAKVTRELKDGSDNNNYGIEWIDASCDNEPATLKFLIENLLLGATGRIKVDRNRDVSDKALYTFVFASRKAITDYAIKKFMAQQQKSKLAQIEEPPLNSGPATSAQLKNHAPKAKAELSNKREASPSEGSTKKIKREDKTRELKPAKEKPAFVMGGADTQAPDSQEEKPAFAMGGADVQAPDSQEEKPAFAMGGAARENTNENNDERGLSDSTSAEKANSSVEKEHQDVFIPPTKETDNPPMSATNREEQTRENESVSSGKDIGKNRRGEKRAQIYGLTCSFVIRGTEFRGSIRNMSRSGALLTSNDEYPPDGSLLTLKLKKGSEGRSTRINATVTRDSKSCRLKNTFAVRFLPSTHRGHARDIQQFFDKIFKSNDS